jgi:hypothetical protein
MNRILSWARNSLSYTLASDLMLLSMNKDVLHIIVCCAKMNSGQY